LVGTTFFLFVHLLLVKWITQEKLWVRWTFILYGIFFCLSFFIYLFGKWTGTLEQAYGISRKIAGALQSLVPLMLIIPGWWIWKSDKNKKLHS
jgi:drug/metabolite transporter (DMT)-like permease